MFPSLTHSIALTPMDSDIDNIHDRLRIHMSALEMESAQVLVHGYCKLLETVMDHMTDSDTSTHTHALPVPPRSQAFNWTLDQDPSASPTHRPTPPRVTRSGVHFLYVPAFPFVESSLTLLFVSRFSSSSNRPASSLSQHTPDGPSGHTSQSTSAGSSIGPVRVESGIQSRRRQFAVVVPIAPGGVQRYVFPFLLFSLV